MRRHERYARQSLLVLVRLALGGGSGVIVAEHVELDSRRLVASGDVLGGFLRVTFRDEMFDKGFEP
jgi:hypothetical protein